MSEAAIKVSNVSKRYLLGAAGSRFRYRTLRDSIMEGVTSPLRRLQRLRGERSEEETLWALRDVSFELEPGEVVGIIGRNGAGKSTLLKVLSRITEPTTGRIELRGRVASLLEVGTGFHPELTGRENIFLNGAILGMSRREIERKFDEIVDFAEVERFIDTPVKRYSSGMYLRLAFAVAAHLEPEILVVDEVLAVGDAGFQKKCMGQMDNVARQGRTVLFVSHNMEAVRTLTRTGLFLDSGRVAFYGSSSSAIAAYFKAQSDELEADHIPLDAFRRSRAGDEPVTIETITINGKAGATAVDMMDDILLGVRIRADQAQPASQITVVLRNDSGQVVTRMFSSDSLENIPLRQGITEVQCRIPHHPLTPGRYSVDLGVNQSTATRAWDGIAGYPCLNVVLGEQAEGITWPDRPWGAVHFADAQWSM